SRRTGSPRARRTEGRARGRGEGSPGRAPPPARWRTAGARRPWPCRLRPRRFRPGRQGLCHELREAPGGTRCWRRPRLRRLRQFVQPCVEVSALVVGQLPQRAADILLDRYPAAREDVLQRRVPWVALERGAETRRARTPPRDQCWKRRGASGDRADGAFLQSATDERLRSDEDVESEPEVAREALVRRVGDFHSDEVRSALCETRQQLGRER